MYEFDLKTFVRIIVKSKKWIIINCCIAMGLAIVVAFSIPKEYSASVSLASELQGEENIAGFRFVGRGCWYYLRFKGGGDCSYIISGCGIFQ